VAASCDLLVPTETIAVLTGLPAPIRPLVSSEHLAQRRHRVARQVRHSHAAWSGPGALARRECMVATASVVRIIQLRGLSSGGAAKHGRVATLTWAARGWVHCQAQVSSNTGAREGADADANRRKPTPLPPGTAVSSGSSSLGGAAQAALSCASAAKTRETGAFRRWAMLGAGEHRASLTLITCLQT
jgi:hypothetical protein